MNALGNEGLTVLDQVAETCSNNPKEPKCEEIMTTMGKMLIKAGANVDGGSGFEISPLMAAIATRKCLLVRELLQANCGPKVVRKGTIIYNYLDRDRVIGNFMGASFYSHIMDCAAFLFLDCCSTPEYQDIQELFVQYFESEKESLAEQGIHPPPVSLARLCRVVIRASLPRGRTFQGAVDQLPLPENIKDFIGLRSEEPEPPAVRLMLPDCLECAQRWQQQQAQ